MAVWEKAVKFFPVILVEEVQWRLPIKYKGLKNMPRKSPSLIYCSAHEILRFFLVPDGVEPKSLNDFFCSNPIYMESLDLAHLLRVCQRLVSSGYLMAISSSLNPSECYYITLSFDEECAAYGEYEFAVEGFSNISERLGKSVFPVIVEKPNGEPDIGTAFLLGNLNTIFTARHVVEGMKSVKIYNSSGDELEIIKIYYPENDLLDVALIAVTGSHLDGCQPLKFDSDKCSILDEVICVGFPPIPGFESIKIVDKSEINSFVRISRGRVVGNDSSYIDKQDYLLLNARVKGGNSGGPLINNKGYVVGMLTQIPIDSDDASKIDSLGYGIAVPKETVMEVLAKARSDSQSR